MNHDHQTVPCVSNTPSEKNPQNSSARRFLQKQQRDYFDVAPQTPSTSSASVAQQTARSAMSFRTLAVLGTMLTHTSALGHR